MVKARTQEPEVPPPTSASEPKKPRIDARIVILHLMIILIFGVLLSQLWRLQIVEGHSYRRLADINRFRVSPVDAPRGVIYDRNKQILASNRPSFMVAVVPAAVPEAEKDRIYGELSKLIDVPVSAIADKVAKRRGDDFTPVGIKTDVDRDVVMRVEERHLKLPGVVVVPVSARLYPYGPLTSHLLGYMLPITEEQLAVRQANNKEAGYRAENKIGAAGLEATYELQMRGKPGRKLYEVDATERPVADLRIDSPEAGQNLVLSLDIELQKDVERLLKEGMGESLSAVAVVMDPRNGQILSLVSIPSYDNNLFSDRVKPSDLEKLLNDPRKLMINYAISGTFPPGSTYKLVTAAGALQEGVATADTVINCPGALIIPNEYNPALPARLPCWGVHGPQDFVKGLTNSCDVYYWTLGGGTKDFPGLGVERLGKWARLLGYGAPTGIDLPGELSGLVPTSEWKQDTLDEVWVKGDTYNMAIGQGFVLATPLQVANVTNAIANGGRLLKPRLVAALTDSDDKLIRSPEPEEIRRLPIDKKNLELIREGMKGVPLNDDAIKHNTPELKIAGKTGTAEFPGIRDAKGILPTHGWFTAYAPYDNPQVTVTVFVQRGGGPGTALPIAMKIMRRYFNYPEPPAPTPTAARPVG